ncbi:clamp-binding protein CrfC [Cedecea colo]|uniref:Clamp-binding protein CrfC n=1 Tax=Cedecea colo TaxID=2552946 RepID=A0ABX0VR77_9ENTR|nr:clamp-binding protein CrfC [Cedecea colo]NIY49565.1 clamp-binding protein CrfC [Cedecea colo]
MHTQTIFELSQEAERLLQLALQNLHALKTAPFATQNEQSLNNLRSVAPVVPLQFSARGINVQQAMLQNELRKITQHEMVLAIVGTMKAGKSTTINAIIGTEVLPNRNRPMTALPTLIRHTPGQREPILHFPHVLPIEALMGELQQKLKELDREALMQQLEIDRDMDELLSRIACGGTFEKHYLGAQPIFHCLKSLNDLVRLSGVLEVPFPFKAYAAIEHVPVIEVEFIHLAGMQKGSGQLTLLDTPGPNEAGQPHLQKMLQEQLSQASAVLAVMDYTQLKSISDEEVRRAILGAGKSVPLYVLVNKFDQKDRNSDDESQVKALISGTLMKGNIEADHVFPVSSMWGYLANRARFELAEHGQLPDPQEQRWVQDFAEAALGRRWRSSDLADIDHIRHAADLLWEDSMFDSPVKTILHAAHANASMYTLRAAAQKLLNYAQGAEEYLSFRCQGLQVANEKLQSNIRLLEDDLSLLQSSQQDISRIIRNDVEKAVSDIAEFINRYEKRIKADIDDYFQQGKVHEDVARHSFKLSTARSRDFEAGCESITVVDEQAARLLLNKIRASSEIILLVSQQAMTEELALLLNNLEISLMDTLRETLKPIEKRVADGLALSGFRAHISLPAFQASQLNFNAQHAFNDVIDRQEIPVSQLRRQNGMRGAVARWLNSDDWGWEGHTETQSRYVIALPDLQHRLHRHVASFLAQLNKAIVAQVDISVMAGMASFFADFTQALEAIKSNLQQSLVARLQNEEALQTLQNQLLQCVRTARYIHEDTRLLKDDIQTLFAAEHQ